MTRTEKVALVRGLRDREGLLWREISAQLGIPLSTAQELYADPKREKSRERKARYLGSCVDCGATTQYDVSGPYERCLDCSHARQAQTKRAERDTRGLEMIELRRQGLLNNEIAERMGCSQQAVANLLCRLAGEGYDVPPSPYNASRREVLRRAA